MAEKKYLSETLLGPQIVLRKQDIDFAETMYGVVAEDRERLSRFLPWPQKIQDISDEMELIKTSIEEWDSYKGANYIILSNADNNMVGCIGSFNFDWNNETCEIGYWIRGVFEGCGYMSEAVSLLEEELFTAGFNRIVIKCEKDNMRSKGIPKRLGYVYEGFLRECRKQCGRYVSLEVYSKLKSERKG